MRLRTQKHILLAVVLTFIFCLGMFGNAFAAEHDIYAKIESFTWKEYGDDGSQLLK